LFGSAQADGTDLGAGIGQGFTVWEAAVGV
jgi:hypothetical protein